MWRQCWIQESLIHVILCSVDVTETSKTIYIIGFVYVYKQDEYVLFGSHQVKYIL